MTDFDITTTWLSQGGRNEADATFCSLLIKLGDIIVTEFADLQRQRNQQLEIPAYFLAEWIAENWWPLLWEPTKNEEDRGSRQRKSVLLGAALKSNCAAWLCAA